MKHWTDLDDLSKIISLTGTFNQVHGTGNREFGLRFVEHDKNGKLFIGITSVLDSPGGPMRAVRIQTRAVRFWMRLARSVEPERSTFYVPERFVVIGRKEAEPDLTPSASRCSVRRAILEFYTDDADPSSTST